MGIGELLATGGLGLLIVFAVLAVLIVAIGVMTMFFGKKNKNGKSADDDKKVVPLAPVAPVVPAAPVRAVSDGPRAAGSCGGIVLNGVEEKTAAMLMAIVADELKTPLCELRFASVREINE